MAWSELPPEGATWVPSTPDQALTTGYWVDSHDYAEMSSANSQAVASGRTLLVSDTKTISGTVTLSAVVSVIDGGSFVKGASGKLVINGPFEAGLYAVFSGFSAGDVTFGSGTVKEVFPQWWGAVGDGATDDKTAIDSAFASYHHTHLVKGVYYCASGLASISTNRFLLTGVGRESELKGNGSINILSIFGTSGSYVQYPTVRGVSFTGTSATAIKTRFTTFLEVDRCIFANVDQGIHMSEGDVSGISEAEVKPRITNNYFAGGTYGIRAGAGAVVTRIADSWVVGNLFQDQTIASISATYFDGGNIINNKVFSDVVSTTANIGFTVSKPVWLHVVNNEIYQVNSYGMSFPGARYCEFVGNNIVWTGQNSRQQAFIIGEYSGITSKHNVISNNHIRQPYGSGIYLVKVEQSDILHNYIESPGYSGGTTNDGIVLVQGTSPCSNIRVKGNIIDGQTTTRYWLYADGATDLIIDDNIVSACVQGDLFAANGPTFLQPFRESVTSTSDTTYNALYSDEIIIVSGQSAAATVNLKSATVQKNKKIIIKNTDATYQVTIDPVLSQTIDGALTQVLAANGNKFSIIVSDGSNWQIIGSN